MTQRKPCIRCERGIDTWATICPFCNWNQSQPVPVKQAAPAVEVTEYTPPAERSIKKKLIFAAAGVLLLIASFGVGMVINRDGAPENAPEPVLEAEQEKIPPIKRADTPLVPMDAPGGIEQPITSAPAPGGPAQGGNMNEWDRSDATAVSAEEYAQLAKRAKAEKKKMAVLVDPRTITGAAYAQAPAPRPRAATPAPQTAANDAPVAASPRRGRMSIRTRPVPQHQPLPPMRANGTARFDLIIGPDGRVRDIHVRRTLDGNTAALIDAVQSWRFKPATENGEPIAAPYSVEISFRGND